MIYFLWFILYFLVGLEILICLDRDICIENKTTIFESIVFIIAWLPLLLIFAILEIRRHAQKKS